MSADESCSKSSLENVECVNQLCATLHIEKTECPWKKQVGSSFSQNGSSDIIACGNCTEESNDACAFCCTCTEFLCKVCHESHKRSRKLAEHNVIELYKETPKQLQSFLMGENQLCSQPNHSKNLTFYCKCCKCFICQDCTNGIHKGHSNFYFPCGEKDDESEGKTTIAVECAQDIMKKLITASEINNKMIQQLETQKQICSQDIHRAFESLHQTLKVRKSVLLSKLEFIARSKMANLMLLKEECERMALDTKQYSEMVSRGQIKQYSEMVSRGQIAVAHTALQSIQLAVDSHCVPHDDEAALKVLLQFNEISKQLSQFGEVLGLSPSPSNSTWSSASVAKVNVSYRIEVETRSTNDEKYMCGGLEFVAKLIFKTYRPEFVIAGEIEDHGDGTYTVIFTALVAGTYQLQIMMDGQHIKRSPCDIEVVANYAYFDLQRVLSVTNSRCIALDKEGNIYAGIGTNVYIYNSDGQLNRSIAGFGNTSGIHVQGDMVYVADNSKNCITKLTTAGEMVGSVSLQSAVQSPTSVALDCHNRIMVLSSGSRIQIFTEDGVFLLYIDLASYGCTFPRCVALDPQGNIHVIGSLNAIMVFTPQGTLYRMYGDVKDPIGIAIDKEGYSIVCEAGGSLTVFHPHGNKVYSTRNPNQAIVRKPHMYDLSSPLGVAVNPTGSSLYVAYPHSIVVYSLSKSM